MRISVIIASRLQAQPGGGQGELYLHRSLASVRRQTVALAVDMEIVVGLDPAVRLAAPLPGVVMVNADTARQACAINAAVAASRGELLAILEDDDVWHRRRLEYGLRCLDRADLVTSNQLEVDAGGKPMQVNDYPTPSGWLLPRAVWERVGPFDESFSFPDSEYLGRVHMQRLRRVHLVEAGAAGRPGLGNVASFSAVAQTGEREPLVLRSINPHGVTGNLRRQEEAKMRHEADCRRLLDKYGMIPW